MTTSKKGCYVQCHVDIGDPHSFVAGEVLEEFQDSFILRKISPNGQWDGFTLYPISDLVYTEENTQYLSVLKKLLLLKNENPPSSPKRMLTGLQTILSYAIEQHRIVALELCKSGQRDVVGYFMHQNDTYVQIEQIDISGVSDGIAYVRADAITRVYVADADTACYELLHGSMKDANNVPTALQHK